MRTPTLLLLASVAACSPGCADRASAPLPEAGTQQLVSNADGRVQLSFDQRTIEISDVLMGMRSVTTVPAPPGGNTPLEIQVEGHALELRGDVLHIGPRSYGRLGPRASVRIDPEGVQVDGEHRGPLPAAAGS